MNQTFDRLLHLPARHSHFLFGARNTGKSTLVGDQFPEESTLFIDLLKKETEARFTRNPDELYNIVKQLPDNITHVLIDEVQKLPDLLDVVHRLMSETDKYFVLTGSSARKFKHGGANLLAGRAFVYDLYPLTHLELGDAFKLDNVLQWGSLPDAIAAETDVDRTEFLYAYAHTYLKEEIWSEKFIKNLDPFRRFLEVAAQSNGKLINFSNIAKDVDTSDKTIQNYYSILEDTLLGFFLLPYHGSFRKRIGQQPRFYLFDTGVVRALNHLTDVKLKPQTNAYGNAFEHFIILEAMRLASYHRLHYKFSFLRTQDDEEIDLIVERPGKKTLFIEIKSSERIDTKDIRTFIRLTKNLRNAEAICICKDTYSKKIEHVITIPWRVALKELFTTDIHKNT